MRGFGPQASRVRPQYLTAARLAVMLPGLDSIDVRWLMLQYGVQGTPRGYPVDEALEVVNKVQGVVGDG